MFFVLAQAAQAQSPIVIGTLDTAPRARTTHSVAIIDSVQLRAAGGGSLLPAITGKVAGARIVTLSGSPGGASAIVLRSAGVSAVTEPLIIVDGVVSHLSLGDLNVEDIERVEILKGAAAGAVYGFGAGNGVVRVITKRSRDTVSAINTITLRSELTQNRVPKLIPISMHHAYRLNAAGTDFLRDANGNRILETDGINDNRYPGLDDPAGALLGHGTAISNSVSLRHRRDGWFGLGNYYASLQHERDEGIVSVAGAYSRKSVRFNLDRSLGDNWHFDGGLFYTSASTGLPEQSGALIAGLRWIEPHAKLDSIVTSSACVGTRDCFVRDVPAGQLGLVVNPLYTLEASDFEDERKRLVTGLNATYRPLNWLDVRFGFTSQNVDDGVATFRSESRTLLFRRDELRRASATSVMLSSVRSMRRGTIQNTSRVAWINERTSASFDEASAASASASLESARTTSVLFATAFELGSRVMLDGAIRRDEPSKFGPEVKPVYHRLGAAYQLIDLLNVRISTGASGVALPPGSEAFTPIGGGGGTLGAPFVRENEYGIRASLPREVSAEYTYAQQRVAGYAMLVPSPTSTGFDFVWRNVGVVLGHTHEASLGVPILAAKDYSWRADLVAQRTRSTMSRLIVPQFFFGGSFQYRARAGEPLGTIYGTRWIRTEPQLAETIRSGQLAGTVADYVRNEEGYFVRAAEHRTVNERPLAYFQCTQEDLGACTSRTSIVPLGMITPDLDFGITNSARWKAITIHATLSGVSGGVISNDGRRSGLFAQRDEVVDQSKKPAAERKPGAYYAAFVGSGASDFFVESASHLKVRELALDIVVPRRLLSRARLGVVDGVSVGVVGRNLWTSSAYSGHDPDVVAAGSSMFDYHTDVFQHPAYRTIGARLRAAF